MVLVRYAIRAVEFAALAALAWLLSAGTALLVVRASGACQNLYEGPLACADTPSRVLATFGRHAFEVVSATNVPAVLAAAGIGIAVRRVLALAGRRRP